MNWTIGLHIDLESMTSANSFDTAQLQPTEYPQSNWSLQQINKSSLPVGLPYPMPGKAS